MRWVLFFAFDYQPNLKFILMCDMQARKNDPFLSMLFSFLALRLRIPARMQ